MNSRSVAAQEIGDFDIQGAAAHFGHASPRFSRDESAARFLDRVFDGAAGELVLSLLRAERIPPAELARMQKMIADARNKKRER